MPYLLALILVAAVTAPLSAEDAGNTQVRVLSFNIRYGTANDGENSWPHRAEFVCDLVRTSEADFIGLQEALRFQIDAIRKAAPGYAEHGVGRDDGKTRGEYSAILYRSERWKLDDGGTFWLSDTPETVASKTWGNSIPRIVTWGRFVDRQTGRGLYVFNTHFDHQSQPSREKSSGLIVERIRKRKHAEPVIVTGDFNAGEANPAIKTITAAGLVDTFRVLHPDAATVGTFNGFAGRDDGEKIDYVFVDGGLQVKQAEIVRTERDGRYPSDHFPVSAELLLPAAK